MNVGLIIAGIVIGFVGLLLFWSFLGWGLMLIGFILFIVGLVSPSQQQPQQPIVVNPPSQQPTSQTQPKTPEVLAICPECKNRIPSSSNFCPKCGTDLRPKTSST